MRKVGRELGVEGMSLYHHVRSKDDLLDALATWAVEQIDMPSGDVHWRAALEHRARSARRVLRAHPWAVGMIDSRPAPGLALLRHHDAVLGWLFAAGFSAALAVHTFAAVDAYVYGCAITESGLPFEDVPGAESDFADRVAPDPEQYPNVARMLGELLGDRTYSFSSEFDAGLELLLDSVERRLDDELGVMA